MNLEEDVTAKGISSGLENYRFEHVALPECSLDDVSTTTSAFGYTLRAPVLVSCMTGGVSEAREINRCLARMAEEFGFILGLGSARVLLERPETLDTFDVRDLAPSVPLLANLGAVQLNRGVTTDDCRRLVDMLRADVLVLHLNPLQEALQPEGDTDFAGLLSKIETLCRSIDVPVMAKEIGWGIAPDLVAALIQAGVQGIDVAGAGGTSWSEVERHRLVGKVQQRVAAAFAGWGNPTAQCLVSARAVAPDTTIFASGGVRDGIDVAKCIALGADAAGMAGPFLRAAADGEEAARELAAELTAVLRTVMFATGCCSIDDLRKTRRLLSTGVSAPTVFTRDLRYTTTRPLDFLDITADVHNIIATGPVEAGIATISSRHTTAAIRINENEPLLIEDFRDFLERLAPEAEYQHNDMSRRADVPSDEPLNGHAHLRHLLLSSSEVVTVANGEAQLGPWQRIFLIELDSPRERTVTVQVIGR